MSEQLSDEEGVLFRQVHPQLRDESGKPSSAVFCPTPKDDNQLSVDRSSLTSAKDAFDLFIMRGFTSAAVFGVTVAEFNSEGLSCKADPLKAESPPNPAHALVDYSPYSGTQQKKKAKKIKSMALARGQLHPTD